MTQEEMEELYNLEQPQAHFAMTGYNIMPLKLENPIIIDHPFREGKARVISTNGFDIQGNRTFGVEYGHDFKFYEKIEL